MKAHISRTKKYIKEYFHLLDFPNTGLEKEKKKKEKKPSQLLRAYLAESVHHMKAKTNTVDNEIKKRF